MVYRFPKDADIKNKWILASGRYSWFPQKYDTICSEHFEPELVLKKNKNVRLAKDAVPTLKLHPVFDEQNTSAVEAETAIAPEDNDPGLCSRVKKEDVTEQCEDLPFVNRCDDCQTFFVSKNNIKADRSNIQDRYRCSECQVGFKTKRRLHRHINSVHSYETIYSCDYCRKKFTNKEYILIHMKIEHARGSFKCDESEPNIYICDYCGKTFTYRSNIIPHLYKHTANTKCAICEASVKPGRMKRHVLRMLGDEEVQCEHCGETVKSEYGFQQHVNDHLGHDQRDQQYTGPCGEHDQQSMCSKFGEESGEGTLCPEVNAGASASSEHQYEVFIKEESADQELDLGPVVFQHIDSNYRPYKEEPLLD